MTIILETERLFLRELLLNDVEPLTALLSSPEVTRFTGGPRDENAVRRFVKAQHESYREHGYGYWAVVHRDSGTPRGTSWYHIGVDSNASDVSSTRPIGATASGKKSRWRFGTMPSSS